MVAIPYPSGPSLRAPFRARWLLASVFALVLLAGGYALVLAQVSGDRGIAPTASSTDIEVRGIEVDVTGDNAEDARSKGWKEAARKAWAKAGGPAVSDGQLNGLVSAIVIQRERLGPKRYVATLGVTFDRQRAGRYLGGARAARASAPMLLIPVTVSGGTYTTFEVRNPWQRAWAEFNPGTSRIDYVRPTGAGGDSLLLNYGQAGRRSRAWWRLTLDQYGAADALVAIAKLDHQFPGGPIKGTFTARYGPDSTLLESFSLNASGPGELSEMLGQAVDRIDRIYEQALADGKLQPDPTLRLGGSGEVDPAIARLIEIGRAVRARNAAQEAAANATITPEAVIEGPETPAPAPIAVRQITVQFATPDPGSFDASLIAVRQVPGVQGVAVTSTAMGGTSVMQASFAGDVATLAAALRARGFNVREGANALAISR
ncbi:heavy-metal-associated domain-containing protein [Erythrobacter sp. SCSIO 43205]|uniref:heavy-metal-associated domain-containing protein n=1 Tax=Erythrobacter sp. SCSIO 43205 TaxID=2779361 RepID=UPI001CA87FBE|nr:heavy-metal-associated domain-containing protein [Erythrobacter sp. SCSIO 43205]UAB77555.1 heavy-metal-associated domain-containing protein [Erythrobacter sp. SCSIO 43205]